MSEEINYKQLWDLAENNVRALEEDLKFALETCKDWERAYARLFQDFEAYKKAHP